MHQANGELVQIYLEEGGTGGRLLCPQNMIPETGQYLLAHDPDSDALLAAPVFSAGSAPGGFLVAPSIPQAWQPGMTLSLRGPLGRGFSLPASACCVAVVALEDTIARLKPLIAAALGQGAAVVLVSDLDATDLPLEVEVRPVAALGEVAQWADFVAIDVNRESLPGLREKLENGKQAWARRVTQVLVRTPMPCGGMAECGVCAVPVRRSWKMACKDGPVFDLKELT